MATWSEFERAAPELAARVGDRLKARRHHTMATLRRDGAPRISGTEVEFEGGQLCIGLMPGTRRAADLGRDPRVTIHSQGMDPDEDTGEWVGEAKVSGHAVEVPLKDDGEGDRFSIELTEVSYVSLGVPADHLVIELWRPGEPVERIRR
jgi:hypothetical protein